MFGFGVAIVTTVTAFGAGITVSGWDRRLAPLLLGAAIGLVVAVLLALSPRSAMTACSTYPDQVKELRERVREADVRLKGSQISTVSAQSTAENVLNLLCGLIRDLKSDGAEWLDGSGFLDCWAKLHEAEENLLLVEDESEVTSSALYDLLRLNSSQISGKDGLVAELKVAIPFLSDKAAAQIGSTPASLLNPEVARRRIRSVRLAIDEDREQQWDQIVRSRNGLITAAAVAMGIAYVLVALAVALSAAPGPMESALALAFVAALVSAIYQLLVRSNAENEVEDFGFSTVKLIVVPVLAGVTALLAVAFLTEFQIVVGGQTLGGTFTSWQATFDWRKNAGALATAIIIGFAPNLFFTFVQSKVDQALSSIKSSQASGGAST